jgi:LPS export ABC transporter permease LptG/LPS export ABC transporter permease LptF
LRREAGCAGVRFMKIIDRYVIRQLLMPFGIGLLVFTFLIMLRPLQEYAENLVAKNIPVPMIGWLMVMLVPQALALTIPMSLLLGLLVGFGRLSADREFVAMQACGIGLKRLLIPVGIVSFLSLIVTGYIWFYGYPNANAAFLDTMVQLMAERAEGNVRPHVFYREIPNVMLYVRDVPPSGDGWDGVFMADTRPGVPETTYMARHGRIAVNRAKRTVDIVLEDTIRRTLDANGSLDVARVSQSIVSIDPGAVLPIRSAAAKGLPEMTVSELKVAAAEKEKEGLSSHNEWVAIHQKYAIPFACVVFGVIGLALGATHRRDGALGSFVLGLVVVFAYYIPLYMGPQMVKGDIIPPWLAAWLPNIILGALALALFVWRERVADQPIRLPGFLHRRLSKPHTARRSSLLGFLRILDRYVTAMYLRILVLSAASLMAVFYISTFIDRADKLFKGTATSGMLADYFWYVTPQYVYYVIPLAVLLATLITVAVLTRNSELIVMKACGVSLYRIAVPMFICAAVAAGVIYTMDRGVVGPYFERAERLRLAMNGQASTPLNPLSYGWIQGGNDDLYFFRLYDPKERRLAGLTRYEFSRGMTRLVRQTYAENADFLGLADDGHGKWRVSQGWTRDFADNGEQRSVMPIAGDVRQFEPATTYGIEQPEPKFMRLGDLQAYTERMIAGGYNMFPQQVWVARRNAFPFVTLIMTLIAVPFAVTVGRGGAMAGIAVGIGLALVYWVSISIFAALGGGGLIAPTLAAWAPNMLFGAAALYLLLTVRT